MDVDTTAGTSNFPQLKIDVLNNEDIEWYETHKLKVNGKNIPYQMMWYPPFTDNPQFMIVADDPEHPYLGLDPNPYDTKDIYPYVPKTYTSGGKLEIDKNHFVKKILYQKRTTASSNILSSDIIISPDGLGTVSSKIKDLLLIDDLYRIGMVMSKSSLLHCIIYTMKADEYLDLDIDEREKYVLKERKKIAKRLEKEEDLFPEVSKQELYDYYPEDIIEMIRDPEVFLDPALYYRILEEYYDINIFTFTNSKYKDEPFLELPKHKYFHDRSLVNNNRPVIVIYKHSKIILSRQPYPQCELVIEDVGRERNLFFTDPQIIKNFNTVIEQMTKVKVFDMEKKEYSESYDNKFRYEEFSKIKGLVYNSQMIDTYGKTRCINVTYKDENYSIFGSLSYPLNIIEENEPFYSEYNETLKFITEVLGSKFNISNIRITLSETKIIDGIWFSVFKEDKPEDMYITINPVISIVDNENNQYPIENKKAYVVSSENKLYTISEKIHIYKKIFNIMIQVCNILLIKYGKSPDKFVDRYMVVNPDVKYNLNNIERRIRLQKGKSTFRDYFRYFSRYSFVDKIGDTYKIIVDSDKAKESILYMLENFYVDIKNKKHIPTYFENFYTTEEDYIKYESSKVFMTEGDFMHWISITNNNLEKIYERSLTDSVIMSTNSIIYKIGDMFYILQNVIDFSERRALNVIYNWKMYKKNIGYEAGKINSNNIPENVTMATINSNNEIEIYDTESEYVLLYYVSQKQDRYAALLPL